MKNRNLPMFVAALALLAGACSDSSVTQPLDVAPSFAGGSAVTICHFPPGKSGNPQVISVGAKAAAKHIAQHEGDGIVGVDLDEKCQPLAVHAWAKGTLFTYQDNPDGARHFPFNVLIKDAPRRDFRRFCDFTGLSHPVDLELNDGTVIGEVSVDCTTLDEMSLTFTITDAGYVLQEIEGLTDNRHNCVNLSTEFFNIPLTDLSQWQFVTPLVEYASKLAEGLTTATLAPFDVLQVFSDGTGALASCAVAHALVVPS